MKRLLIRWSTRRCRGCDDPSVHTHHLTWLGHLRYGRGWARTSELGEQDHS